LAAAVALLAYLAAAPKSGDATIDMAPVLPADPAFVPPPPPPIIRRDAAYLLAPGASSAGAPAAATAPAACFVQRNDYLGDGWCDDISPYNTAACGWDKAGALVRTTTRT